MRVKCLAQEHNTMTRPGFEPGPLDLESNTLTTRPLRLPHVQRISVKNIMVLENVTLSSMVRYFLFCYKWPVMDKIIYQLLQENTE